MKKYFLTALLFTSLAGISQNRNSVWCLGDSSGIDFGSGSPAIFTSTVESRGSCVSIADSIGQLLFYAYTRATIPGNTTRVINRNHSLMSNGSNVVGEAWYQELTVVPNPANNYEYYLFTAGSTGSSQLGLYYSVIDITQDSGRGSVTLKNIQLFNYKPDWAIIAIKHANGRDWWLLARRGDTINDEFHEFLITPFGIAGPFIVNAGSLIQGSIYWFSFSKSGNKMLGYNEAGTMDLFDFDRCTGNIVLNQTISIAFSAAPYPYFFGSAFSPNEDYLYVSANGVQHPTYLIQYDLTAPIISATADTIWSYDSTAQAGGMLELAPDGKIYMANAWYDGVHFNYPYPDSVFNQVNNNLSVINYPDSPGVACGFAPFSFNLGAGRCYWGLPNNPDYELGAVVNSMCDTVTGVQSIKYEVSREELHVFYHPGWQVAFINGEGLRGRKFSLQVFDLYGRMIYSEEGSLSSAYFTKDLPFDAFANGMYIVTLRTDKEVLSKKFIKE